MDLGKTGCQFHETTGTKSPSCSVMAYGCLCITGLSHRLTFHFSLTRYNQKH